MRSLGEADRMKRKTAEVAVDENLKALVASDDQRIGCQQCCGQGHFVGCHARIEVGSRTGRAGRCSIDREWLVAAFFERVDLGHRVDPP